MTVSKPNPCQMLAAHTASKAVSGSESHWRPSPPKNSMARLISPSSFRSIFHIVETTTRDIVTGRKNAARKSAWPTRARLSRSAETSPRSGPMVIVTRAKIAVFPAAVRNWSSAKRSE